MIDCRMLLRAALLCLLAGALISTEALAMPKSGFALYGGIINSADDITSNGGFGEFTVQASGLSLGAGYQFGLSSSWSANVLYEISSETVNGDATGKAVFDTANHSVLGVGLRAWAGNWFVGGHLGNYTEALTSKAGATTTTTSGSGSGGGLTVGYEGSGGGFLALEADAASIDYTGSTGKLTTTRVQLGYRW